MGSTLQLFQAYGNAAMQTVRMVDGSQGQFEWGYGKKEDPVSN